MEFDDRSSGSSGMVFSGDYEPGTRLSQSIDPGDEVTLKVNGNQLRVTVDSIEGDAYTGTVERIIDEADELGDLEAGDEVEFSYSNIWARHRSI